MQGEKWKKQKKQKKKKNGSHAAIEKGAPQFLFDLHSRFSCCMTTSTRHFRHGSCTQQNIGST